MLLRAGLTLVATVALAQVPARPIVVKVDARAIQPGEVVALTLTTKTPADDVRISAFGRAVPAFRTAPTVWRALVGIDLDVVPRAYEVAIEAGPAGRAVRASERLVVRAKAFPTRRLTVDEQFVNPPAEMTERIAAEARELDGLWASSPARLWDGAFSRPVPQPANSAFGTRSIFNGQLRSPHGGADFPSPTGTPIAAPNAGRVVLAKSLYYTGGTVVIDHGLGLVSLFGHLSRIDVTAGDVVAREQTIGAVGATGRVSGPHLHWTLRLNAARVDPLSLLAVLGDK